MGHQFKIAILILLALSSCTSMQKQDSKAKLTVSDSLALVAANNMVLEIIPDAEFNGSKFSIESNANNGRIKIVQYFKSASNYDSDLYYRVSIKDVGGEWLYDYLQVNTDKAQTLFDLKGTLSSVEDSLRTAREEGERIHNEMLAEARAADKTIPGYKIVRENPGRFILIYTRYELNTYQLKAIYRKYANRYEQVQFTTSYNPNDEEYFAIGEYGVFDFRTGEIMRLEQFL